MTNKRYLGIGDRHFYDHIGDLLRNRGFQDFRMETCYPEVGGAIERIDTGYFDQIFLDSLSLRLAEPGQFREEMAPFTDFDMPLNQWFSGGLYVVSYAFSKGLNPVVFQANENEGTLRKAEELGAKVVFRKRGLLDNGEVFDTVIRD